MIKKSFICVLSFTAVVVLSGCYTARTYVVNKERVDQEISGQAAETPVKTRKVVVFEVIEKDKGNPVLAADGASASADLTSGSEMSQEDRFALPESGPVVEEQPVVKAVPQNYIVEKDDTLQKISKKVYGSYGRWPSIYDANRDVIKDPNFLTAGITLKIPPFETLRATENK
jgi:nucleoid-associated protein YgaU